MTTAATHPQQKHLEKNLGVGMPMLDAIFVELKEGRPVPELTQDEVDDVIRDYEHAQVEFNCIKSGFDDRKQTLIAIVQAHGNVPPHAEQSKRLQGIRNIATVTTGTVMNVNEDAVAELEMELTTLPGVFEKMFATNIKHQMIDGARSVLATIKCSKQRYNRVLSLFGRCIDPKPKAASLKIEVIKAEKPAKLVRAKAPRGSKAAA